MTQDSQYRRSPASLYTQVEISAAGQSTPHPHPGGLQAEQTELLRDILSSQDRSNELLEELVATIGAQQKQRMAELNQWKKANPVLAKNCRAAAEGLSQVQSEFLHKMTEEVSDTMEDLKDGEFVLTEFVDRFGPRLAHLNGIIQVLAQLSSVPNPADPVQP